MQLGDELVTPRRLRLKKAGNLGHVTGDHRAVAVDAICRRW